MQTPKQEMEKHKEKTTNICRRNAIIGRRISCTIQEQNPVPSEAMYSSFVTKELNSS
jgi:hypothetical protein